VSGTWNFKLLQDLQGKRPRHPLLEPQVHFVAEVADAQSARRICSSVDALVWM
jgi:hypothetical protein